VNFRHFQFSNATQSVHASLKGHKFYNRVSQLKTISVLLTYLHTIQYHRKQ